MTRSVVLTTLHGLSWAVIVIVAVNVNGFAEQGVNFGGRTPVPFKINPHATYVTIWFLLSCIIIATTVFFFKNYIGGLGVLLIVFAMFVPASLTVLAVFPSSGTVISRDIVEGVVGSTNRKSFGFPIFFSNGIAAPGEDEKRRVKESFSIFRHCEASSVSVRGFASSLEFSGRTQEQSNTMNLKLANDRAASMGIIMAELTGQQPRVITWPEYRSMVEERRIRDMSVSGDPIRDAERLNRRVEIFWNDSKCLGAS